MQPFPPTIQAFQRLRASDGLLITVDGWQRTQSYHRQRQNFYYQSLHEAGIVSGLGVSVTAAPEAVEARYRNGRWIQVAPGIAIDAQGNPIVVTEPSVFQVQSRCEEETSKTVYIVLTYVDPDELRYPPGQDWVTELYRIVEKTTLDVLDVELCRIQLTPGEVALTIADDVFNPPPNTLDLTQRKSVRPQSAGVVSVAHLTADASADSPIHTGFVHLLRAVRLLYPDLQGNDALLPLPLGSAAMAAETLEQADLAYLSYDGRSQLSESLQTALKTFIEGGGVLLVAADGDTTRQDELANIKGELVQALAEAESDPSLGAAKASIQSEIAAIDAELSQFTEAVQQATIAFGQQLGLSMAGSGAVPATHPLRTAPFLFSQWPQAGEQPVSLFAWGGIVLCVGPLAPQWGPDGVPERSRQAIRSAHEMGINLLHYAWQRRQLMQLQQGDRTPPPADTPESLTRRAAP